MKDVTSRMENFRKAACHNWNSYLMPGENILQLDVEQSFEIIERELLRCLVLSDMEDAADKYRTKAIDCLAVHVIEYPSEGPAYKSAFSDEGNTRWDELKPADLSKSLELRFYDFFDWNHYSLINYEFVRAVDVSGGKRFLIPTNLCRFSLIE
ncbi:hypothetical protein [Xanthomonas oryzae]|uniref:hypothetical protein n=1 Tax=Xanthomonas oryzae TaxID=347 RepID=UPI0012AFE294|nr:hypothetical protein [Xanthomonas oryzae]MEC5080742.1 hypothetical protein [Xanthomonas oryzae pv. oryzicola]MEC5115659.1 hypothetical protein [Xanthomonas oryzae pv. oryzicola]